MKTLIAAFIVILTATPVWAGTSIDSCIAEHNACVSECRKLDSASSQAACVAKCAGLEAQCVGEVGISSSEPYLRQKKKQLENLLDEFFNDLLPETEEKSKPTPSPTDT